VQILGFVLFVLSIFKPERSYNLCILTDTQIHFLIFLFLFLILKTRKSKRFFIKNAKKWHYMARFKIFIGYSFLPRNAHFSRARARAYI